MSTDFDNGFTIGMAFGAQGAVIADDELSTESTNPVQNKVVTAAINALPTQSDLTPLAEWAKLAESNRKIKVVAGVIRNSGSGWEFIENGTHAKLGLTSISANASAITVNFNFTAKKILGFSVTPDETFIQQGISCGASVGTTNAVITVCEGPAIIGGYVYYDTTAEEWKTTYLRNIDSVSFNGGNLTLNHEKLGLSSQRLASASGFGGSLCTIGNITDTTTTISFYDFNGTKKTTPDANCKAYVTRMSTRIKINPLNLVSEAGNFWIMGVFEVD